MSLHRTPRAYAWLRGEPSGDLYREGPGFSNAIESAMAAEEGKGYDADREEESPEVADENARLRAARFVDALDRTIELGW